MKMTLQAAHLKRSEMILSLLIGCSLIFIVATYFTIFFEFMLLPVKILVHTITIPLIALIPEYIVLAILCMIYYKNFRR